MEQPRRKFLLREIARLAKVSTTAAKAAIGSLLEGEIVKKTKERNFFSYSADLDSEKFKAAKKFCTIDLLNISGLLDFIDEKLHRPEVIILFGSASRGEDVEESDIDLFALAVEKKEIDLSRFEKALKRKISLMQMTKKEFEAAKKKSPELINNIANGTIMKGHLKVI